MIEIRRRRLIVAAGAALASAGARAQDSRVRRVGLALTTSPVSEMSGANADHPGVRAFVRELQNRGYLEGKNLVLERRSAEGKVERFPAIITDLVKQKVEVIAVPGDELPAAAMKGAPATPVVLISSRYPVEAGLVKSLARPGGNVTGLVVNAGPEVEEKRLQLLKTTLPGLTRVAFLGRKTDWEDVIGERIRAAARALRLNLRLAEHAPDDYRSAFASVISTKAEAMFVVQSPANYGHRRTIVAFAAKNRLPATYANRDYADIGGLISYGPDAGDQFRRAAVYVDRILRGARPAELPVEQPLKFELVFNMKTAAALGITIPQAALALADDMIR